MNMYFKWSYDSMHRPDMPAKGEQIGVAQPLEIVPFPLAVFGRTVVEQRMHPAQVAVPPRAVGQSDVVVILGPLLPLPCRALGLLRLLRLVPGPFGQLGAGHPVREIHPFGLTRPPRPCSRSAEYAYQPESPCQLARWSRCQGRWIRFGRASWRGSD